jgi:hypothetical protein
MNIHIDLSALQAMLGNASLVVDFSARSDGAGNTAQIE